MARDCVAFGLVIFHGLIWSSAYLLVGVMMAFPLVHRVVGSLFSTWIDNCWSCCCYAQILFRNGYWGYTLSQVLCIFVQVMWCRNAYQDEEEMVIFSSQGSPVLSGARIGTLGLINPSSSSQCIPWFLWHYYIEGYNQRACGGAETGIVKTNLFCEL